MIKSQFKKLHSFIINIFSFISIVLLSLMGVFLGFTVVTRYIFNFTPQWVEAFSSYSLVWLSFLGGVIALHERKHIGVNIIIDRIPIKYRKIIIKIMACFIGFFSIYMFKEGIEFVQRGNDQYLSTLKIRKSIVYLIIPMTSIPTFMTFMEIVIFDSNVKLLTNPSIDQEDK